MKLADKKEIKRLAIYAFFDAQGKVDEYVKYFLNDLKKNVSEILVVCNGILSPEGRDALSKYANNIVVRPNEGYDITAYKEGLRFYGWEQLEKFDEVMLINDTLFGPFYPFKEMFDEMDTRDLDFWGITKHHSVEYDCFGTVKYGYMPEHIQSSFTVFRQSLVKTREFQNHWDNLRTITNYAEAVGYHEAIFTKDFGEMGFKWGLYIDTSDLEGYTRYPLMMMSSELIINRRCPVMKRKSFSQNYYDLLGDTVVNATIESFEYIDKHLDYDVNMIWDNILRTNNMADIKKLLHLNYTLPAHQEFRKSEDNKKEPKVALMMHLYYDDMAEWCLKYAKSMPETADIYITTTSEEKKKNIINVFKSLKCNKLEVIVIQNRGRDVSSLLVGCRPYVDDYDYICYAHDKKTTQIKPYCVGESFAYKCFENILATPEFVQNIISTFEDNPRLGLLTPPPPNHGRLYNTVGSEWANNFNNTASLAHKLKLNVDINWRKEPIAPLGTMFWFRPEALKTLFEQEYKYEDFPSEPNGFDGTLLHAIERVYAFVVQHEGYYPAWVMSDDFARIELTNLDFMLREVNLALFEKYYTDNVYDMVQAIRTKMILAPAITKKRRAKEFVKKVLPSPIFNFLKKVKNILVK